MLGKKHTAPSEHVRLQTEEDGPEFIEPKAVKKNFGKIHTIYTSCVYKKPKPVRFIDSEISSSLSFQKLIYFNVYYSILHFYIYMVACVFRWLTFKQSDVYDLLRLIFIFAPWGIIEIFRIQNGFAGNIKESFPEIVSFLLQTVFQIILNIVLISFPRRMPIEGALLTIQILFNCLEFIFSIISISKLQKAQSALFFWKSPYSKKQQKSRHEIVREYQEQQEMLKQQKYNDTYRSGAWTKRSGNKNYQNLNNEDDEGYEYEDDMGEQTSGQRVQYRSYNQQYNARVKYQNQENIDPDN